MMFKKGIAMLLAVVLIFAFTACGVQNWQNGGAPSEESNSEEETVKVSEADYENNLDGLCSYMEASGYLSGDELEMEADIIGACAGKKYTFKLEKVNTSVEIYEFDTENLSAEGKATVDAVKSNGKFDVFGTEVSGVISDNGKYIMIYAESENNESYTAQRDKAVAAFKAFKK